MIENLKDIAEILGTDETSLKDIISKEESVKIEIPEGTFMTDAKIEELKENVKESEKTNYEENKKTGREMFAKELKKLAGIAEGTPGKSVEDVYNLLIDKISTDLKIEPDKKIKSLKESLSTLQSNYEADKEAWQNEKESLTKKERKSLTRSKLLMEIPKDINGIKPNQLVTLIESEYGVDLDDNGSLSFSKDGKILKDKMEKIIPSSEIITTFITENGWSKNGKGKGEGDYTGSGSNNFKTSDDVYRYMEENNIHPDSETGKKLIEDFQSAGAE